MATTTASDIHQTLTNELEAASCKEQHLRRQEATIKAQIDGAKEAIKHDLIHTQVQSSTVDSIEGDGDAEFELHRLKETHAALKSQLEDIEDENRQMVDPEMKRLHRQEVALNKENDATLKELAKETHRLQQLEDLVKASISERVEAEGKSKDRRIELTKGNDEPKAVAKQIKDTEKQSARLRKDMKQLEERIVNEEFNIDNAIRQRKDVDASRRLIGGDIEASTDETDAKEREFHNLEEKVDLLKAQYHSLATKRLEGEIALKKTNESIRHAKTVAALENKQLEYDKRLFVKKRLASDKAKNIVPQMQSNCQDSQASLSAYEKQSLLNQAILDEKKEKLHMQRLALMRNQSIGSDVQKELLTSIDGIEEKEMQIEKGRAEEKKLGKIIAVIRTQCNLVRKKASQLLESIDDTKEKVQIQNLTAHNIEKMYLETNKRRKELSALYEALKSKQEACTKIIQASEKATSDLKSKVETLEMKLDQAKRESSEKSAILSKEYDAHESSVAHRANLQAEQNRIKSLLREKNFLSERQCVQLKKLDSRASTLEREIHTSQEQNRKASAAQRLMLEQLNDRDQELSRWSERSSLYRETLEHNEAAIKERKDYIRAQTLQCADLRRTVEATKRTMPDAHLYQDRISSLESDILIERKNIEQLSLDLEDPNISLSTGTRARTNRATPLEAQINVLENRLHISQNRLLEKEVELETLSLRCREMEEQQAKNKEQVKPLIQDLVTCRGQGSELSRTLISLMSELRMYQQSNIALSEEKTAQERALATSDRASAANGEAPSKEARRIRQMKDSQENNDANSLDCSIIPTSTLGRPNAYLPFSGGKAIPFGGAHGPFQPYSAASGGMRHFRAPRVLTIEEIEQQANEVRA